MQARSLAENTAHTTTVFIQPQTEADGIDAPGRLRYRDAARSELLVSLISVRVAEDGTCESMPAPTTTQPPSVAPSMTFAPTPTPPYEYAPTVDAMPYCRLQSSSVCWGNTHRFLAVTANGPFDGIDVDWFSKPALGDRRRRHAQTASVDR